jgi:hypothetical protein
VHFFGAGDFKAGKNHNALSFECCSQVLYAVNAAVIRDPDDLNLSLDATVNNRCVVGFLRQSVAAAALILLRVSPRIHLKSAFPEFGVVAHGIRALVEVGLFRQAGQFAGKGQSSTIVAG